MTERRSLDWVYERLVCEFEHWDICQTGLVRYDDEYLLCRVRGQYSDALEYELSSIDWDAECDEYLDDYRVAYKHWFHTNGRRQDSYGGWSLEWFYDKWQKRNPIKDKAKCN